MRIQLITCEGNHYPLCDYKTPSDFKPVVSRKLKRVSEIEIISSTVKHAGVFARESDVKGQEPNNDGRLDEKMANQKSILNKNQNDIKDTHITRRFIIPNPPKLMIQDRLVI